MDSINLLILTVYFIVVAYVFYQSYKSLENQVTVIPNTLEVNRQLDQKDLGKVLDIKFKFRPSYKLYELTTIPIEVKNKSLEAKVEIDWKQSYISNFDKVAQRVVRVVPGITDNPSSQDPSVLFPGVSIKEEVSDEDVTSPIFKEDKLKKAAQTESEFALRLVLKVSAPHAGEYSLRCPFIVREVRWTKALGQALRP